ncbi:WhiB family transcriptional regulator [Streptomyces sp. NPDC096319]|uniref:WhiB family transcriptional regulator n=1 Tax=Streptomyces sp. NPDC096319 TaxID=3366084 RepID=UPI00380B008A
MSKISHLPGRAEHEWAWQRAAACRGLGTEVFFHPEGERGESRVNRERAAKAVCDRCPVRAQCLRHAVSVSEPYGVWGGRTVSERQPSPETGATAA